MQQLVLLLLLLTVSMSHKSGSGDWLPTIQTVNGALSSDDMGKTLIHEHVLVDFIGADSTGYHRWDKSDVVNKVLPYLLEIQAQGFTTLIECTPAYLGRDPELLQTLSKLSGLQIVTNTGYYGARQNKYLPSHAFTESTEQLADRWITEWKNGIENTGIRPGFIKISVDQEDQLSPVHQKLIRAAGKVHHSTGLTIASHTLLAEPAFQQLAILGEEGVAPDAFVWVHAQAEKNLMKHIEAARLGAWISLDNIRSDNLKVYVPLIDNLKQHGLLNRVLISHDAGWYSPREENGGEFRGYTDIENFLLPALIKKGFTNEEIDQILVSNPAEAFGIRKRLKQKQ